MKTILEFAQQHVNDMTAIIGLINILAIVVSLIVGVILLRLWNRCIRAFNHVHNVLQTYDNPTFGLYKMSEKLNTLLDMIASVSRRQQENRTYFYSFYVVIQWYDTGHCTIEKYGADEFSILLKSDKLNKEFTIVNILPLPLKWEEWFKLPTDKAK